MPGHVPDLSEIETQVRHGCFTTGQLNLAQARSCRDARWRTTRLLRVTAVHGRGARLAADRIGREPVASGVLRGRSGVTHRYLRLIPRLKTPCRSKARRPARPL